MSNVGNGWCCGGGEKELDKQIDVGLPFVTEHSDKFGLVLWFSAVKFNIPMSYGEGSQLGKYRAKLSPMEISRRGNTFSLLATVVEIINM